MKQKGRVKFVQKDNNAFFPTLKARVDAYFQNNNISPNANAAMVEEKAWRELE
jgi:linoleoyl-CoA desaturase